MANNSSNEKDFVSKHFTFSIPKKTLYNIFKEKISQHKGSEPTNYEMWEFIKHFVIIYFDLENESSIHLTDQLNLMTNKVHDVTTARSLLNHLFCIASEYNPTMGTINYTTLSHKCRKYIKQNLDLTITQLDAQTKTSLDTIRDIISNDIKIPRTEELNKIRKAIACNDHIILAGEPLTGKSVFLKMLANEYIRDGKCLFFKVDRFEGNSLQSYLHKLGIDSDFEKLLTDHNNIHRKCIFIDGLEYADNPIKQNIIKDILLAVTNSNKKLETYDTNKQHCWKIVCSSRTADLDKFIDDLKFLSINYTFRKIPIIGLNDDEKNKIIIENPHLNYLIHEKNLEELFSRPGIIDLTVRQNFPHDENTLREITSESQFIEIFC